MSRKFQIGDVVKVMKLVMGHGTEDILDGKVVWAVVREPAEKGTGAHVTWLAGAEYVVGISRSAGDHVRIVPEKQVPDWVWAEIAKRALTGE